MMAVNIDDKSKKIRLGKVELGKFNVSMLKKEAEVQLNVKVNKKVQIEINNKLKNLFEGNDIDSLSVTFKYKL